MLRFFIDRPIFSSVISILIVIGGAAALRALPIEQYPDVVPPRVVVTALYPGASAQVLADSVAAP
ncbi:efflux RND transporter permease subunit, partial [Arthrospira platensis SPKY2]